MSQNHVRTVRRVRLATTPSVSVVVASTLELSLLENWLVALESQCRENNAQLVVMRGSEDGLQELLDKFPAVVFASANASAGSSVLRSVGVSLASGDIVAITDDSQPLGDDWVASITQRRALTAPQPADSTPLQ